MPVRLTVSSGLRLVPIALAALVYFPIVGNFFVGDDFLHLYHLANLPLLQNLVRIKSVAQQFGVASQDLALPQFSPRRPRAQLLDLVLHLGSGVRSGFDQSLVQAFERLLNRA